jgi:LysR family transcriptional activator of dmlA
MTSPVQPADLGFFSALAACGSLSAAARELGISTPAVSKRLAQMEARLGVTLVNRTTRRMSLTPEGELYVASARRILGEIDDMAQQLGGAKGEAQGLLRVNATLGFGRSHVAPVIARRIASNRRLLCASPAYLARAGTPKVPNDLTHHRCIGIRQGDEAYGVWRLSTGRGTAQRTEAVKTRGTLSTNDGEIAVNWALDGHGILMRAEWDIARYLRSGRLVQVLANYRTPDADIHAVYPQRHQLSARVRAFVDFIASALGKDDAEPALNRR